MARVAEKLAREDNVVGFDSLNEPNLGMAGNVYIPKPTPKPQPKPINEPNLGLAGNVYIPKPTPKPQPKP